MVLIVNNTGSVNAATRVLEHHQRVFLLLVVVIFFFKIYSHCYNETLMFMYLGFVVKSVEGIE